MQTGKFFLQKNFHELKLITLIMHMVRRSERTRIGKELSG